MSEMELRSFDLAKCNKIFDAKGGEFGHNVIIFQPNATFSGQWPNDPGSVIDNINQLSFVHRSTVSFSTGRGNLLPFDCIPCGGNLALRKPQQAKVVGVDKDHQLFVCGKCKSVLRLDGYPTRDSLANLFFFLALKQVNPWLPTINYVDFTRLDYSRDKLALTFGTGISENDVKERYDNFGALGLVAVNQAVLRSLSRSFGGGESGYHLGFIAAPHVNPRERCIKGRHGFSQDSLFSQWLQRLQIEHFKRISMVARRGLVETIGPKVE